MLTLTSMDLSKGPLFVGPRISRPGDKSFALSLTGSYQLICYLEYFAPQFHNSFVRQQRPVRIVLNILCLNPCPQSTGHYRANGQWSDWESGFGWQLIYNRVQICLSQDMISRFAVLQSRQDWPRLSKRESGSSSADLLSRGETGNGDSTPRDPLTHSLCSCLFVSFRPFIWEDAGAALARRWPQRKCESHLRCLSHPTLIMALGP